MKCLVHARCAQAFRVLAKETSAITRVYRGMERSVYQDVTSRMSSGPTTLRSPDFALTQGKRGPP